MKPLIENTWIIRNRFIDCLLLFRHFYYQSKLVFICLI